MTARTWPALEVARTEPAAADDPDLLQAALVDYRVAAIEPASLVWRVFFDSGAERDRAAADLPGRFPELSMRSVDVPDDEWAEKSQADLRAVRVGNVIVAPPWDVPHTGRLQLDPDAEGAGRLTGPIVVVIQPSTGFGTAHHATTRLCLAALQELDLRGRSAVDLGTGSGVLAITASRLGAAPVVGLDDDPDALRAAAENLSLNRVADVTLRAADVRAAGPETFDLVMANLTGALLVEAAARVRDLTAQRGRVILSGFVRDEEEAVRAAYAGFTVSSRSKEDEWVCVGWQRP